EDTEDSANPSLSGKRWLTYYQYDSMGRPTETAEPSAVQSYTINGSNALVVTLLSNSGLIHLTDYYNSTTATSTTAGGVAGFFKDSKIQHGSQGTPVLQETKDYFNQTGQGRANVVLADDTVYRNTDGTGAETTSYGYTWFTNTVAVQS